MVSLLFSFAPSRSPLAHPLPFCMTRMQCTLAHNLAADDRDAEYVLKYATGWSLGAIAATEETPDFSFALVVADKSKYCAQLVFWQIQHLMGTASLCSWFGTCMMYIQYRHYGLNPYRQRSQGSGSLPCMCLRPLGAFDLVSMKTSFFTLCYIF